MPLRVPSQTTSKSIARKPCATANAGNTCPPVPPAAIMTVLREELEPRLETGWIG